MIFSILLLIIVLAVTFIHFVQGMFSATLSAILTIIAAMIALGFHEDVITMMKPGKIADSSTAVIICVLFVVSYVILRVIFDKAVSGNVRLNPTADKVGAAVMGLIAGIYCAGIISIAAQTMPFGPTVFGHARYATVDVREVKFQARPGQNQINRQVMDEMKGRDFSAKEAGDPQKTWIPVDDVVLGTMNTLSDGSLSGARTFASVHPDFLQEAFGQRIGLEPGAKHTATNFGNQKQISVEKIIVRKRLKQVMDSELPEMREEKKGPTPAAPANPDAGTKDEAKLAKEDLAPKDGAILVLPMRFEKDTTEKDNTFRFSLSAIRLVVVDKEGKSKNIYPVGTMDTWGGTTGTMWPSHLSDPLLAVNDGVELVFVLDNPGEVLENAGGGTPRPKTAGGTASQPLQVKAGTFLEVKRLARVDLGGMSADDGPWVPTPNFDIMRKMRMKMPPATP